MFLVYITAILASIAPGTILQLEALTFIIFNTKSERDALASLTIDVNDEIHIILIESFMHGKW